MVLLGLLLLLHFVVHGLGLLIGLFGILFRFFLLTLPILIVLLYDFKTAIENG